MPIGSKDMVSSTVRGLSVAAATGMILAMMTTVSPAAPRHEMGQCMPRMIAKGIKESVLAMKAAQYCKGMPYTISQAAQRVEELRCSPQASEIIDGLLSDHNGQYKLILKGDTGLVACTQAAQIKIN